MLKDYINELKHRIAVYVPIKGDEVDQKLAEFINNFPDRKRLKIAFMRESPGLYSFGQKQVNVSLRRDALYIKIGGGYISIEQFVNQSLPEELSKLEKKDPLKKVADQGAAVRPNAEMNQSFASASKRGSKSGDAGGKKSASKASRSKLSKTAGTMIDFDNNPL